MDEITNNYCIIKNIAKFIPKVILTCYNGYYIYNNDLIVNKNITEKNIDEFIYNYIFNNSPKYFRIMINHYNKFIFNIDNIIELTITSNIIIEKYPRYLKKITFTDNYTKKVINLPDTLEELILNTICIYPPNLKKIKFGKDFNERIENLPDSLEELILGNNYNRLINKYPSKLKKLVFGYMYDLPLLNIPNTIEYLELGFKFSRQIKYPLNLKTLISKCINNFYPNIFIFMNNLPNSIINLEIYNYNFNILKLPENIQSLKLVNYNNYTINKKNIILPDSLKLLEIYNSNISFDFTIPKKCKYIIF